MARLLPIAVCVAVGASGAFATTNIDSDKKFAWAENIGWTNWRDADGGAAGVRVDATFLSGFIWAENAGWINMGDGSPADGVNYTNLDGADHGVNIVNSMTGELGGLAWGENIGWINFATTATQGADGARWDETEGRLRGYAWAENVGWINLDDSFHFIATEGCAADLNGDGMITAVDLATVLSHWGTSIPECDLNGDGDVSAVDLAIVLSFWGPCP